MARILKAVNAFLLQALQTEDHLVDEYSEQITITSPMSSKPTAQDVSTSAESGQGD